MSAMLLWGMGVITGDSQFLYVCIHHAVRQGLCTLPVTLAEGGLRCLQSPSVTMARARCCTGAFDIEALLLVQPWVTRPA